jgi:shikimate kinase
MQTKRIFLIGPMGAGKTTVGKQLAARLDFDFADSDWEIQHQTGVTIPRIFETEGEVGFRNREVKVIDQLTQVDRQVLAIGGGGVLRSLNRQFLADRGLVVYLHCSPEQQFQRTRYSQHRPLLQTSDPLARLQAIMLEREPLYRAIADHTVFVENRTAHWVVDNIMHFL